MARRAPRPHLTALLAPIAATAVLLTACAPADEAEAPEPGSTAEDSPAAAGECSPESLPTLEDGVLTVATDEPAFEPWVVGDAPGSGEGFEAAVAYAVAEQLGYAEDQVEWVRVPFTNAIQPGPKDFDFDINQFSITDERAQVVDFSSPYYEAVQAVVTTGSSPAADAESLADLQGLRIGAQVGTTSLDAAEEVIAPSAGVQTFNTNDDAKLALENGQIDAVVVDLPTAFFISAAELEDGVIVGQLAGTEGGDAFGLLLELDSPLTDCVTQAVDALREDGTLEQLEQEWLADVADAPVLE